MADYRRCYVPGGSFFFTVVTERWAAILGNDLARDLLRAAFRDCRQRWPFRVDVLVMLPDHLHAIWTLPPDDADYSKRWGAIKKHFTQSWLAAGGNEQTSVGFPPSLSTPGHLATPVLGIRDSRSTGSLKSVGYPWCRLMFGPSKATSSRHKNSISTFQTASDPCSSNHLEISRAGVRSKYTFSTVTPAQPGASSSPGFICSNTGSPQAG